MAGIWHGNSVLSFHKQKQKRADYGKSHHFENKNHDRRDNPVAVHVDLFVHLFGHGDAGGQIRRRDGPETGIGDSGRLRGQIGHGG